MLEPAPQRNVYALPPGCNFARELVEGIMNRQESNNPIDLVKTELFLSTGKLREDVRKEFISRNNLLLPQFKLINELCFDLRFPSIPLPNSSLQRRLELMKAVKQLLDNDKRFASQLAHYDLAQSLEALLQELHQENIDPQNIKDLDLTETSEHWQKSLKFIEIITDFWQPEAFPVKETRQNLVIDALIASWEASPPKHTIIIAGSTGSVGSTQKLMTAVAKLPQGILVLPSFDTHFDPETWQQLDGPFPLADHPQFRNYKLTKTIQIRPETIPLWTPDPKHLKYRNELISLALIPAPVTNQWMKKIPHLKRIGSATEGITLLEALSPRKEALAIALTLRLSLEKNQSATLVTADESLVKQVKLALRKWHIVPNDTRQGIRLFQTIEGRFLVMLAKLIGNNTSAEELIALLKHPLTSSVEGRKSHLKLLNDMEFDIRSRGIEFNPIKQIKSWAVNHSDPAKKWHLWFQNLFHELASMGPFPLEKMVKAHCTIAEKFMAGHEGVPSHNLFRENNLASVAVHNLLQDLIKCSDQQNPITPEEYTDLFVNLCSEARTRQEGCTHPSLMIMSTEDARMHTADLVIAGGLNEGIWPTSSEQDPWLNRKLRLQLGLNVPEQKIGLAGHDFQHVVCLSNVILSRSIRDADNPTTPSRWLSRIISLLQGAGQQGEDALRLMKQRGEVLLEQSINYEKTEDAIPYKRPCPCPPCIVRPKKLSVTQIRTLITDPYAIYAREVLRLRPISRLRLEHSSLLKGILFHEIMEEIVKSEASQNNEPTLDQLLNIAQKILEDSGAQPFVEAIWVAHIRDNAKQIIDTLSRIKRNSTPQMIEQYGEYHFTELDFKLKAKTDRIDQDNENPNHWHLFDYKSGNLPSKSDIENFEKQMPLQTIMAEQGAFSKQTVQSVVATNYISIGKRIEMKPIERYEEGLDLFLADWDKFQKLIGHYTDEEFGYISRRLSGEGMLSHDYDHLARYGEWLDSDPPNVEEVADE